MCAGGNWAGAMVLTLSGMIVSYLSFPGRTTKSLVYLAGWAAGISTWPVRFLPLGYLSKAFRCTWNQAWPSPMMMICTIWIPSWMSCKRGGLPLVYCWIIWGCVHKIWNHYCDQEITIKDLQAGSVLEQPSTQWLVSPICIPRQYFFHSLFPHCSQYTGENSGCSPS